MATGKVDKAKGTFKEAAGTLAGNKRLKREGKADKAKGQAKEKVKKAARKTDEAIDKVAHAGKRTVNRDNM